MAVNVGVLEAVLRLKDELSPTLASVDKSLASTGKNLESLGFKVAKVGVALSGISVAVGGLGSAAVIAAGNFEQTTIAFNTMLGSAEKAQKFLQEMQTFAAKTPFEFTDVTDAAKRLLALGFSAEQVLPMLRTVGDAVAGLGGGAQMIDRITLALGQMQAKGKVSAQEMQQLAEAGIPAWQMLADKIGVSIPEAMKMAEKGAILAADAIPAILEGMNEKFGGLMEQQSKTLLGQWSNVKDQIGFILRDLGTALMPIAKQLVDFLSSMLPHLQDAVTWFSNLSPPVKTPIIGFAALLAGIGPLITVIGALIAAVGVLATGFTAVGGAAVAIPIALGGIGVAIGSGTGLIVAFLSYKLVDWFLDLVPAVRSATTAFYDFALKVFGIQAILDAYNKGQEKGKKATAGWTKEQKAAYDAFVASADARKKAAAAAAELAEKNQKETLSTKEAIAARLKAAEAAKAVATEAKKYAKELQNLSDKISGKSAREDLDQLVKVWRRLTPEQQENDKVIQRLQKAYKDLRKEFSPSELPADLENVFHKLTSADIERAAKIIDDARTAQKGWNNVLQDFYEKNSRLFIDSLDKQIEKTKEQSASARKNARELKEAAKEAERINRESTRNLYAISSGLQEVGGQAGGAGGAIVSAVGQGIGIMATLGDKTLQTSDTMTKLAHTAAGLGQVLGSTGIFSGAMAGAQAGSSFGPWGALIGAAAGALIGYDNAQREANRLMKDFQTEIKTAGTSLEEMTYYFGAWTDEELAGLAAMPGMLTKIMDKFNEIREKALARLSTAIDGIVKQTDRWYRSLMNSDTATAKTQEQFERLELYATAAFARIMQESGDLWQALQQLAPALEQLIEASKKFGLETSYSFEQLIGLYQSMSRNKEVMDAAGALLQIMQGLGNQLYVNSDLAAAFGADVNELFNKLIAGGATSREALVLLQPLLQQLWQMSHDYGVELDDNTKKLLAQAEAQGIVGEQFKSTEDKILDALIAGLSALIEAVGGQLPAAWAAAAAAAQGYADTQNGIPIPTTTGTPPPSGSGPSGPSPGPGWIWDPVQQRWVPAAGHAMGGITAGNVLPFLPRAAAGAIAPDIAGGTAFVAGEGGSPELIAPIRALAQEIGAAAAAAAMSAGGGTMVFPIYIGGEKLDEYILQRTRTGHMQIDGNGVRHEA